MVNRKHKSDLPDCTRFLTDVILDACGLLGALRIARRVGRLRVALQRIAAAERGEVDVDRRDRLPAELELRDQRLAAVVVFGASDQHGAALYAGHAIEVIEVAAADVAARLVAARAGGGRRDFGIGIMLAQLRVVASIRPCAVTMPVR